MKVYPSKKENLTLYNWINYQRLSNKKGVLSKDKIDKLNSINFIWSPTEAHWQENISRYEKFLAQNNNNLPSLSTNNPLEKRLAQWVNFVRKKYRLLKLSQNQVSDLRKIGFIFTPHHQLWFEKFTSLKSFIKKNGRFPQARAKTEEGSLYRWCKIQSMSYQLENLKKNDFFLLKEVKFEKFIEELPTYEKVPVKLIELAKKNE